MKYIGLMVFIGMVPLIISLLSQGLQGRRLVAFIFGAAPFFVQSMHSAVAPISWMYWPGYVKGVEVSLIDSLALAIVLGTRPNGGGARPFHLAAFFLLAALALLSAFQAPSPTAAVFVAWQILKVCLVYVAASRLTADFAGIRALVAGLIFGLACNGIWAGVQHFQGVAQAPGLTDHQNTLGLMTHFVALPAAALFAADARARWAVIAIGAAGAVAIFGASRATVGLEAGGLALLMVFIAIFWPTSRGFALMATGALAIALLSPLAYKALAPRLAQTEHSAYDEREAFQKTAEAMIHDHPLGVGANHYIIVANTQGYSNLGQVGWAAGSRSANVHNAYLLTAAEMGWLALVPFVWLLVLTALQGMFWCFRSPDKRLSIVLFGACLAEVVAAVHNLFEWVFVTYVVQVVFCLNLGLIAGLMGQIKAARRANAGAVAARPETSPSAAVSL